MRFYSTTAISDSRDISWVFSFNNPGYLLSKNHWLCLVFTMGLEPPNFSLNFSHQGFLSLLTRPLQFMSLVIYTAAIKLLNLGGILKPTARVMWHFHFRWISLRERNWSEQTILDEDESQFTFEQADCTASGTRGACVQTVLFPLTIAHNWL